MDIDVTFPGGKRVDAQLGSFLVHTDQPQEAGGAGSAPAPYDLFLASLATCAGIYALGFCQARSLPTEGLRIRQRVEFDPTTHLAAEVHLEVTPPDGFPEKYRHALERAVAQCKVEKTLASPPTFTVTLAAREPACAGA